MKKSRRSSKLTPYLLKCSHNVNISVDVHRLKFRGFYIFCKMSVLETNDVVEIWKIK